MFHLIRLEWRKSRRDPALWGPVALLAMLLLAAVFNGASDVAAMRHAVTESQSYEAARLSALQSSAVLAHSGQRPPAYALDGSSPSRVGSGDGARRARLPLTDFTSFASGYSTALPQSYLVSTNSRHTRTDGYDLRSPSSVTSGRFDFAFVCVLLLPLFAIALGYNLVSADREAGRLRLIDAQPVSLPRLVVARLALRHMLLMAPVALAGFGLYLWGAPALTVAGLANYLVLLLGLGLYAGFWLAVCSLPSVWGRSSAFGAMSGVAVYLIFTMMVPNVLQIATAAAAPPPNRLEQVLLIRAIDADMGKQPQDAARRYYRDHPDVIPAASSPHKGERWIGLFPKNLELDRRLVPVVQQHDAVGLSQAELTRRLAIVSPPVALNLLLEQWAGTDLDRHRAFSQKVDAYQQTWREFFGPRIMSLASLRPDDYDRLPVFRFDEENAGDFYARAVLPLVWLLIAGCAAIGVFLSVTRRRVGRSG